MKVRTPAIPLAAFCAICLSLGSVSVYGQIQAKPVGEVEVSDSEKKENAKEDLVAYADLLYSNDQHLLAAGQYRLFLEQFPKSPNAEAAWFRLGECYVKQDQFEDATTTFQYLLGKYKKGPFVGSASFRLASFAFNAKDYKNALHYFELASKNIQSERLALDSQFYEARCHQLIGEVEKAVAGYEAVGKLTLKEGENPFIERAAIEIARLRFDGGDTKAAFTAFEKLAKTAKNPEYRTEALTRAGLLATELSDVEASNKYLEQVLKMEGDSPWKALSQVGLIFNYFAKEDYEKVIKTFTAGDFSISDEMRPKMLLIVGHSYRLTDKLDAAIEMYTQVEKDFRETPSGAEAGYRRLQSLHQQRDGGLPVYIDQYAQQQREIDAESHYIDLAFLMKAEWHFANAELAQSKTDEATAVAEFADAADAYAEVRTAKVPEKYHAARLYKLGWSQIESGAEIEGIESLSNFVQTFPKDTLVSSAIAKRGSTYQLVEDFVSAVADYDVLIKDYTSAPEVEFALQQKALIHGQQRQIPEMITAYEQLLAKYPKTSIKAEAQYRIGVGYFDQKNYTKAIPPLEEARRLNPKDYGEKASLRLILSHYLSEDVDNLAKEASLYLAPQNEGTHERQQIPTSVLSYLGRKLYLKDDYEGAEKYLADAITPDKPAETPSEVWEYLGQSRLKLKKFEEAITPFTNYLNMTQRPSLRAKALVDRAQAELCVKKFDQARESVRDALRAQKEGRTNAKARLMLGDIAAAEGDYASAAREYFVVAQVFVDPEITPFAMSKAAAAFRKAGDEAQAQKIEANLAKDFPKFSKEEDPLNFGC